MTDNVKLSVKPTLTWVYSECALATLRRCQAVNCHRPHGLLNARPNRADATACNHVPIVYPFAYAFKTCHRPHSIPPQKDRKKTEDRSDTAELSHTCYHCSVDLRRYTCADYFSGIGQCRGQSYDNGANMAGIHKGVQARIAERNELAEFVPCLAHSLNLVGVHSASSSQEAINFFGGVKNDHGNSVLDTEKQDDLVLWTASDGSRTASPVTAAVRGKFFRARGGRLTRTRVGVRPSPPLDRKETTMSRDDASGRGGGATSMEPARTRTRQSPRIGVGEGRPQQDSTSVCIRLKRRSSPRSASALGGASRSRPTNIGNDKGVTGATVTPAIGNFPTGLVNGDGRGRGPGGRDWQSIAKSLEVNTNVASKSKNLSGPFVKALKLATNEIQESTKALLSRTKTTKTRVLEAANARLSKELAELRAELATLKREVQ
ncbi:zinc finger MYM-type protein 1 [Danaus plexippus plexippus]|uniref:Zinc finger MYM-type protein 1 n=1 Tax=Danaus plexippus plexippus TaxID=278856 RepID=A0A212ERT4_DANPL|nr:zinc finger MYM-type protein 1 [Danaus plexippus plexippus]